MLLQMDKVNLCLFLLLYISMYLLKYMSLAILAFSFQQCFQTTLNNSLNTVPHFCCCVT